MADWNPKVNELFLRAAEIEAPAERQAFLDAQCGADADLRREVESLLAAGAKAGSFLNEPAVARPNGTVDHTPNNEGPGTVIGPYKLLQQIGEGGFGVVYMAEQTQLVRRMVALKIIKPGMDTAQVIARFESERQALALMDHPHIARVLDAGATASGRPYFVMELVKGVPITEFCDRNHLPPEARLKLFLDICHAIQHAHHKGVIHRDIKPSNVMVTLHDGVPVVKVIDFGVAKATGQKLTEKTLFTAYGQMIGTPAYMSPEQAEMSGLDIDTRSDVYALGVLLYELLTGTTPLEAKRLRQAGYAEMQRLIREEEPPRPSTRLSGLGESATALAGNRGLDARRLVQLLAGDLDWVVMKALEKDRTRRYDTPGSFAEDIERYLRHEAILARPPSLTYKLKKLVQRNRAAVLTVAVVAAALLGGTALATWQAVRATRAEAAARAALNRQEEARAAEAHERQRAEANAKKADAAAEAEKKARESAQAVVEFLQNHVLAAARPQGQAGGLGRDVTLRQAIDAALPVVAKSFMNQPLIEARLRLTLGLSFHSLGEMRIAAEQYEAARALYAKHRGPDDPDALQSLNFLANCYDALGRHADALKLYEEALALQTARFGPDHPGKIMMMNNLANSYAAVGRHADALKLHEETLALRKAKLGPDHVFTLLSMRSVANSYAALGRHADAFKLNEEIVKLHEKMLALMQAQLGPDHPDTLMTTSSLANNYDLLGRHANAVPLYEGTLPRMKAKLGPDHPGTLGTMSNLANSYAALGRHADAHKLHEETLARTQAKFGPDHPGTLGSMWGVAESLVKLDRGAEAVPVIDTCVQRAASKGVDPSLLRGVMDLRLRHFEKAKDAAGCRQTAEMWEKLNRADADSRYIAARMRAVTAAVLRGTDLKSVLHAKQTDAEADRAVAWLKQAVAAGYKDVAQMKKDKDLDALREREDFQKLVAELEASPMKQK